ncbi:MAG: ATP-binding cassette domain-containing protein, partial [Anaerolineae bacterium]|nr:ATP-binding cassette domain-containing protein [Anaerolineae bacterium]
MTNIAIRVDQLGKRYQIGAFQRSYNRNIRDVVTETALAPFRRMRAVLRNQPMLTASETIWALKDLSLEIKRGEVVGVIGSNGAGKSTLLKILSRITRPTEGYCEIHGRVVSLLEVGTGFNAELTGRENIYLSGAILGMKKQEIDQRFDEIVEFSGIEQFIDTPVKRYS